MTLQNLTERLKNNYEFLNGLYKRGKFEDRVQTTANTDETSGFFELPDNQPMTEQVLDDDEISLKTRGPERDPQDLQWATGILRKQAEYLYEIYPKEDSIPNETAKTIILYYFRTLSLSYEVDDYFLSVTDRTSYFLINSKSGLVYKTDFLIKHFKPLFEDNQENYLELIKQILIVGLCGVNECYRKNQYKKGLSAAQQIKKLIEKYAKKLHLSQGRWFGLRGLCGYVTGKILTAMGEFGQAEQEFRDSVEAYSESIWQKEQNFFRRRRELKKSDVFDEPEKLRLLRLQQREHDLSRSVALRRIGLVSAFGHSFQSLVLGRVKDALRSATVARGIVNWNTGKIWSAYVDLIYFSAKRAENSSNYDVLIEIEKNLKRCHAVFEALIPTAHYKNRALFQLSLVHHYLARWHKEQGQNLLSAPKTAQQGKSELKKAQKYWNQGIESLNKTIDDPRLSSNKRLLAESMAILAHICVNLGLLEKTLGQNETDCFERAKEILERAWKESEDYPQIQCEVGLAQAAVGKAEVEYLLGSSDLRFVLDETDSQNPVPFRPELRERIKTILNESRRILLKILHLNHDTGIRIQATAYLRLCEISFQNKATWPQAHEYLEKYEEISAQVEHDFCHKWANELKRKIIFSANPFTFMLDFRNGFNKDAFNSKLDRFYADYAVNQATAKIETAFLKDKIKGTDSIFSFLEKELKKIGFNKKAAENLCDEFEMFTKVRKLISKTPEEFPDKAKNAKQKPAETQSLK